MKNFFLKTIVLMAVLFSLCSGSVLANDFTNVSVPNGEKINNDFIQAGENIDVAGDVAGDAIFLGSSVNFSGKAGGDIIVFGGNIRIKGDSLGDTRAIGGNIFIDGSVGKNVTVIGGSVILEEDSIVDGNLYVVGENVELRGKVKGNATVYSSQIFFSGTVDGDADFRSKNISLRSDSHIAGNLTFATDQGFSLENSEIVEGETFQVELKDYFSGEKNNEGEFNIVFKIWQFLSLFLVAIIFFKFFGKQAEKLLTPADKKEFWNKAASGLISLILNPVLISLSFITIIGIPLALMILFIYILLFIVASILSPILVGRVLSRKTKLYSESNLYLDFFIGYILMEVIGLVPVLGGISLFFLFLFSFGRITRLVCEEIKTNR